MKKPVKRKESKKKDFVPIVIYELMLQDYKRLESFRKELNKHIEENYKYKKKNDKDFSEFIEEFIMDSLYGDEQDTESFIKDFNKDFIQK